MFTPNNFNGLITLKSLFDKLLSPSFSLNFDFTAFPILIELVFQLPALSVVFLFISKPLSPNPWIYAVLYFL